MHRDLLYNGKKVSTVPLRAAIGEFLSWLKSLKKSFIAAHNLGFDGPKLLAAINQCFLKEEFAGVVDGFADTLKVISNVAKRKGKGQCMITGLAEHFKIPMTSARNALHDCIIFQNSILRY